MTDPLKAVARALRRRHDGVARAMRRRHDGHHRPDDEDIPEWWMNDARAAIAAFLDAVREPSYDVEGAAYDRRHDPSPYEVWQAMIDALRAEILPPPGDGS